MHITIYHIQLSNKLITIFAEIFSEKCCYFIYTKHGHVYQVVNMNGLTLQSHLNKSNKQVVHF